MNFKLCYPKKAVIESINRERDGMDDQPGVTDAIGSGPDAKLDVAQRRIGQVVVQFGHDEGHQVSRHGHGWFEKVPNVAGFILTGSHEMQMQPCSNR